MANEFRKEQMQYLILHLAESELRRIASSLVGVSAYDSCEELRERLLNVTHGKLIQKLPKANLLAYLAVINVAPESQYVADIRTQILEIWEKECSKRSQKSMVSVSTERNRESTVQSHVAEMSPQSRPPDDLANRAARDFSSLFYNLLSLPRADSIIQMGFFCDDAVLRLHYKERGWNQVEGRHRVESLLQQLMASAEFRYLPSFMEGFFDEYGVLHVHVKGQVQCGGTAMVFDHHFQLVRLGAATHYAIKSAVWEVGCPNERLHAGGNARLQ